ncbi:hypothetical protein MCOR27_011799, partial [Pyricularia oryzae]
EENKKTPAGRGNQQGGTVQGPPSRRKQVSMNPFPNAPITQSISEANAFMSGLCGGD